jgi:hypothetical protein
MVWDIAIQNHSVRQDTKHPYGKVFHAFKLCYKASNSNNE